MSRYKYSCMACGGAITKVPCHTKKIEGKAEDYCGLHGWSCMKCGSGIKVKREFIGEQK